MDPRTPVSFSQLLNGGDDEQNPPQQPTFSQIQQPPAFAQIPYSGGFSQVQHLGGVSQFQQPHLDSQVVQWQQFLQWQQFQKMQQPQVQQIMQQPQVQQPQAHGSQSVDESPSSKTKAAKKKKKEKIIVEEEVELAKVTRVRWPPSDEVLLAKGMMSVSENPIIGNNQNGDAYWGKIEEYYNSGGATVPRNAHNLRSHWHMIKSKINRFNELYLATKSRYNSGWSDNQYIQEARLHYVQDPSNKTSAPFAYEHVWEVVKDHGKYNSSTKVHGSQASKRTKTTSTGGYTSSASDANFGDTLDFGISLDDDNDDIQAEQEPPARPMGRDKAKAKAKLKGKAASDKSYESKKLSLIEDLAETNRVRKNAIEKFDKRIDKFYELEQRKMEIEEKKLLFIDTTFMDPYQRAEHEALCAEIREKYGMMRRD